MEKWTIVTKFVVGTTKLIKRLKVRFALLQEYMKFQKNGGNIGIPKKKSYEIPKNGGNWNLYLEFSLVSPVPNRFTN